MHQHRKVSIAFPPSASSPSFAGSSTYVDEEVLHRLENDADGTFKGLNVAACIEVRHCRPRYGGPITHYCCLSIGGTDDAGNDAGDVPMSSSVNSSDAMKRYDVVASIGSYMRRQKRLACAGLETELPRQTR